MFRYKILDPRVRSGGQFVRGSAHAAGFDVQVYPVTSAPGVAVYQDEVTLQPGAKPVLVSTGVKLWIEDPRFFGALYPRSSTGHKLGLRLGNTVGIIDPDYQGELFVSLKNTGIEPVVLKAGDRVAQIIFHPFHVPNLTPVEDFDTETVRAGGGFGSTGR